MKFFSKIKFFFKLFLLKRNLVFFLQIYFRDDETKKNR